MGWITMKRVDISGFSGPYENACQTMLQRWLKWAEDKTLDDLFPKQDNGKRSLSKAVRPELSKLIEDIAPSGAMFGATLSHLAYIKDKGYDAWIKLGKERKRLIDWNPKDRIHFDSPEEAFERGRKLGEQMKRKP